MWHFASSDPSFIERAVFETVNRALTSDNTATQWRFPKTLTHAFPLPRRLEPLDKQRSDRG